MVGVKIAARTGPKRKIIIKMTRRAQEVVVVLHKAEERRYTVACLG